MQIVIVLGGKIKEKKSAIFCWGSGLLVAGENYKFSHTHWCVLCAGVKKSRVAQIEDIIIHS